MSLAPRELWRRFLAGLTAPRGVRAWAGLALALGGPRIPATPFDLQRVQRLLVIRYDGMGDLVVTTGFFRELRRAAPQARITLLTRSEWVPLMQACPHFDEVLGFKAKGYPAYQQLRRQVDGLAFARRELWPRRFEAALVPQVHFDYFEARALAFFSGAPARIGRAERVGSEADSGQSYLTRVVPDAPRAHEVEQTYHFLEALGGRVEVRNLEVSVDAAVREGGARLASELRGGRTRLIALGIGASQAERIWPLDRFIELGRWLQETQDAHVAVIGGSDMVTAGEQLAAALGSAARNLAGRLSLTDTAAVLAHSDLFIGNDSGPLHLAAAIGLPVIEVSGFPADGPAMAPGSPVRIGPWCAYQQVVQPRQVLGPATFDMLAVEVADVKAAVTRLVVESKLRLS